MLAFSQSCRWQLHDIFGLFVLSSHIFVGIFKRHSPASLPQVRLQETSWLFQRTPCHRSSGLGNSLKSGCLHATVSVSPSLPSTVCPLAQQTFLKFITFHYAPRGAWIHHCAFHGGEGREDVKSFTAERAVATAAGSDGHGWWDLLVPLSWNMDQIICYDQRSRV